MVVAPWAGVGPRGGTSSKVKRERVQQVGGRPRSDSGGIGCCCCGGCCCSSSGCGSNRHRCCGSGCSDENGPREAQLLRRRLQHMGAPLGAGGRGGCACCVCDCRSRIRINLRLRAGPRCRRSCSGGVKACENGGSSRGLAGRRENGRPLLAGVGADGGITTCCIPSTCRSNYPRRSRRIAVQGSSNAARGGRWRNNSCCDERQGSLVLLLQKRHCWCRSGCPRRRALRTALRSCKRSNQTCVSV